MATRREIREAFYTDLESAVSGHIPSSNVSQNEPGTDEDLPALVHNDNYRDVPMNRGVGPTDVVRDNSGAITEISWSGLQQARFTVTVFAEDEQVKEDAYEALHSHFGAYEHPTKDVSGLHTDVFDIGVADTNSVDWTEREPIARGDQVVIDVSFERYYTLKKSDGDFDTIDDIDHLIDADNDGTTDLTYTTT